MIATTATSARPEIVELGTIGESNVGQAVPQPRRVRLLPSRRD